MTQYHMPAEWEEHEATWLAWPHNRDHWPGKFEPVPYIYAEIIRAFSGSEAVYICVDDKKKEQEALAVLKEKSVPTDHVKFFHIPTDGSWARDYGPIFVRNEKGARIITDWDYNAWGGQWPHGLDNIVPQKIGKIFKIPVVETYRVLEGGSIDVNGKGTLITTKQCLLNPNRNPGLTQEQIEHFLAKFLGATNILWLIEGVAGDDTSGHIDDIARFVNATTVVCALESNKRDENYQTLKNNFEALEKMKDQDGNELKIVALPMPDPVVYNGQRLPASYANFYIANKAVLVPTFRCDKDKVALKIIEEFFPTRTTIGIDCTDLVWGLGAIHCSTQQQPK